MKRNIFLLLLMFFGLTQAQNKVLMTVNNKPVSTTEFEKMYTKNLDLVQDPAQKDIDNYRQLFVNYKLELEDAYQNKYDTLPKFVRELKMYRKDLAKKYLSDDKILDKLLKEAYERMQYDVHVAHILVQVKPDALPQDTLKAYKKIMKAYKEALKGKDFEKLATTYSEDTSVKVNKGDLDYITVFNTVYPFETAAYNTPVGKISKPFRTKFGYHIVKVLDKRPARGKVEVAHIMAFNDRNKNKKDETDAKTRIFEIYDKLKNGEDSFKNLASKFSDDRASAKFGGKLRKFGIREMLPDFEDVAFSLKNEGDYSKPFHSKYGWHIIKLLKKYPIESFDKIKTNLKYQVTRDGRSKLGKDKLYERIEKEFPVQMNPDLSDLYNSITRDFFENKWKIPQGKINEKTLFTIAHNQTVTYKDFYEFLYRRQYKKPELYNRKKMIIDNYLKQFKKQQLFDYYENHLQDLYPEFAQILKEYNDGLLMFYIKSDRIWDKSIKDTIGLETYYNAHKENYRVPKRFKVLLVQASDKKTAKKVLKQLSKKVDIQRLKKKYDKLIVQEKTYNYNDEFVKKHQLERKKQVLYKDHNQYIVLKLLSVEPEHIPDFKQVKGKVTNDYQQYLEQEWLKELKAKYPVKINEKEWKKIRAKYKK